MNRRLFSFLDPFRVGPNYYGSVDMHPLIPTPLDVNQMANSIHM